MPPACQFKVLQFWLCSDMGSILELMMNLSFLPKIKSTLNHHDVIYKFRNISSMIWWQSYLEYKLLGVGIPSRCSEYLLMVKKFGKIGIDQVEWLSCHFLGGAVPTSGDVNHWCSTSQIYPDTDSSYSSNGLYWISISYQILPYLS